jgi:hypothetical protein
MSMAGNSNLSKPIIFRILNMVLVSTRTLGKPPQVPGSTQTLWLGLPPEA